MVSRPATATMVAIDDLSSFFILNFPPKESDSLAAKFQADDVSRKRSLLPRSNVTSRSELKVNVGNYRSEMSPKLLPVFPRSLTDPRQRQIGARDLVRRSRHHPLRGGCQLTQAIVRPAQDLIVDDALAPETGKKLGSSASHDVVDDPGVAA